MKREHNDRAWTVWHTAYLTAYAPQKSRSFTRLKALLWRDSSSEKQKPDWKAQFSAFSAWAGSFKRK